MTDTATAPAEAPAEEKAPKIKPEKHPCACQFFEVYGVDDDGNAKTDEVFTTGCTQATGSTFAQGHDARLVSFLVDGQADGYSIRHVKDGVETKYATPGEAVSDISNALQTKAEKAWENRLARTQAASDRKAARDALTARKKAEKEAKAKEAAEAKAAKKSGGPKTTGAEVVAGSAEGDLAELQPGEAIIKVGKFEYKAQVTGDGTAIYIDGSGAEQAVERDGYRVLREYQAPAA